MDSFGRYETTKYYSVINILPDKTIHDTLTTFCGCFFQQTIHFGFERKIARGSTSSAFFPDRNPSDGMFV